MILKVTNFKPKNTMPGMKYSKPIAIIAAASAVAMIGFSLRFGIRRVVKVGYIIYSYYLMSKRVHI